jgi:EAL domain-containing protein (putative c-di-GMP-specific phosphodiesterase class I)
MAGAEPRREFVQWLDGRPPQSGRVRRPSFIPDVLRVGRLFVHYQPLVNLRTRKVFAYEALVRSDSEHYTGPPAMFEQAIQGHCCGALGRIIREMAVESCPSYPLFLNVHPNEFNEGWLVQPTDPIFTHDRPVYLEITESVPLSHFDLCRSVLAELRHKGVFLVVDDLGAGYSNLKYIADLAPDIVKLDRSLVANITRAPRLRTLVSAIVRLCADLGAKVVAEGIEHAEEAEVLVDIGAHYGQGYYFARPSFPPPTVRSDPPTT